MKDAAGKEQDGGTTTPGPEDLSQTSATEKLTSGIEDSKQYAGADVKKLVEDALSADGREQKDRADKAEAENKRLTGDISTLTTDMTGLRTQMSDITKAQNDADADKVKDDPVALGSLRARQANQAEAIRLSGERAAQEAKDTAMASREAAVAQKETTSNIKLAAMAAGVDEKKLADLVPDGDPGRLSQASTLLKAQAATEVDPVTGKPKPAALTQPPASPVGTGEDSTSMSESMLKKAKAKAGVQ